MSFLMSTVRISILLGGLEHLEWHVVFLNETQVHDALNSLDGGHKLLHYAGCIFNANTRAETNLFRSLMLIQMFLQTSI